MTKSKPPSHLSNAAKKLWRDMATAYRIADVAGLHLLDEMCRAYDRALKAEEILDREGPTIKDRFGIAKPHPATASYRDAKGIQLRCLKMLGDIPTEEKK